MAVEDTEECQNKRISEPQTKQNSARTIKFHLGFSHNHVLAQFWVTEGFANFSGHGPVVSFVIKQKPC